MKSQLLGQRYTSVSEISNFVKILYIQIYVLKRKLYWVIANEKEAYRLPSASSHLTYLLNVWGSCRCALMELTDVSTVHIMCNKIVNIHAGVSTCNDLSLQIYYSHLDKFC